MSAEARQSPAERGLDAGDWEEHDCEALMLAKARAWLDRERLLGLPAAVVIEIERLLEDLR